MTLSVKNVTIYSQYFVEKNENIFLGEWKSQEQSTLVVTWTILNAIYSKHSAFRECHPTFK